MREWSRSDREREWDRGADDMDERDRAWRRGRDRDWEDDRRTRERRLEAMPYAPYPWPATGAAMGEYGWEPTGGWYDDRRERGNAGRGPRSYRRPDERIRDDVNDRLTDDREVDASDVEVEVTEGDVVLDGYVENRREKQIAEMVAASVTGVRDVQNRLRVRSRQERPWFGGREPRERDERRERRPYRGDRNLDREAARRSAGDAGPLRRGMPVVGSDGEFVGNVKEVGGRDFLLDRPMKRDVFVPVQAIRDVVNGRIVLDVRGDRLDDMHWGNPSLLGAFHRDDR